MDDKKLKENSKTSTEFHVKQNNANVVFVVEGKNDFAKLKSIIPYAEIITTNGSEISDITLNEIYTLSLKKRIILMLDPDGPGEKIRRKISDFVPSTEHIYVKKELAISSNRRKVGIEHLSKSDLLEAIKHVKIPIESNNISLIDLYNLGLVGNRSSKTLRQQVCDELGLGTANSKTLLYKVNMFGYTLEELKNILDKVKT